MDRITDEPWRDDVRWRDGRARSSALAELLPWWLGAVCFAGILVPLAFVGFEPVRREGTLAIAAVSLFGLAGLWLLTQAVRATLAWRRFGRIAVVLDPFPGSLGGQAGGTIDVPLPGIAPEAVRVVLSCIEVTVSGHGRNRSRHEAVVWSREQRPEIQPGPRGVRLAFTFDLPTELPETEPPSRHHHYWGVRVIAAVPGLDLDRVIEVPVYRTATPLRAMRAAAPREDVGVATDLPATLAPGVVVTREPAGVVVRYGVARARTAGSMLLVFGLIFGGAGVGIGRAGSELLSTNGSFGIVAVPMLLLFVAAFGGVGLLTVTLACWTLGNSLEVRLHDGTATTERRFLGVSCRRRGVAIADVERIELLIDGQVGQGGKAEVSYRMRGVLRGGATLPLGDGIRGTPGAERLAALVEEVTGLAPTIVTRRRRPRWAEAPLRS